MNDQLYKLTDLFKILFERWEVSPWIGGLRNVSYA